MESIQKLKNSFFRYKSLSLRRRVQNVIEWTKTPEARTKGLVISITLLILGGAWLIWPLPKNQAESHEDYSNLDPIDQAQIINEYRKTSISIAGAVVTAIGGIVLYLNFITASKMSKLAENRLAIDIEKNRQDNKLTESRLISERFSKAIEQLGSNNIHIRLGGIYSLEKISKESLEDYWTVIEVLTAFVREQSQRPINTEAEEEKQVKKTPTDIQAVLTILSRRDHERDQGCIDLSHADLSHANLRHSQLKRADLSYTNLKNADLSHANINVANLSYADLSYAALSYSQISRTDLSYANLSGADLLHAELENADISYSILNKVRLSGANLSFSKLNHADLSNAELQGATMSHTELNHVDLSHADLSHSELISASIRYATLDGTNLEHSNLSHANLYGSKISHARLEYANLKKATLDRAKISKTNFYKTNFDNTYLEETYFFNIHFDFTNFSNKTYFYNTILLATDCRDAQNLTPEQFSGGCGPQVCNTLLPKYLTDAGVSNRDDCEILLEILCERHDMTTEEAHLVVNEAKQVKWGKGWSE